MSDTLIARSNRAGIKQDRSCCHVHRTCGLQTLGLSLKNRRSCQPFRPESVVAFAPLLFLVAMAAFPPSVLAEETNQSGSVTGQEVDALIAKVKPADIYPPPETLSDLRGAALLVAALKKDPDGPWAKFLTMAFIANQRTARSLDPPERKKVFEGLLIQLKEAHGVLEADTERNSREESQFYLLRIEHDINTASIEAGVEFDEVKRSTAAMLAANKDKKSWNYGNVIFDTHTNLGRLALREDRIEDAKKHLIQSGRTPGSPQLNSYGPDFILAGELVQAGERQAVIEFLDLVAKFWATPGELDEKVAGYGKQKARNREQLEQWKRDILSGKMPRSDANRTQGWPN